MIEIDCLVVGGGALRDQLAGGGIVELEALLQQTLQLATLGIRHGAVNRRGMDQERGRGDAKIMVAQPAGLFFAAREIGDESS